MAALSSNQRAYQTARLGAFRLGAARLGFIPKDTQGTTPGSDGGYYIWRRVYQTGPDAAIWTAVVR